MDIFFQLTFAPLLVAILASLACALPGNFLVLRKQALIGDAISHVVLPGIVIAFIITGRVESWPMLIGAGAAALFAVGLIEAIRRIGKLEPGAALGVVFTTLFAAGVLLLELTDTSSVHLDVEHALYGNLESIIWLAGDGPAALFSLEKLMRMPPQIPRLLVVLMVLILFTRLFWKELALSSFDEGFARVMGVRVGLLNLCFIALVAATAVAAFDAVGAIIVIAMFVCPAASARLMTNSLGKQVLLSLLFAFSAAIIGYSLASFGPALLGYDLSLSAAGMIATISGIILWLACVFGPQRHRSHQSLAA